MQSARLKEVLGFVAAHVRSLRSRRGLTQEQFAELARVDLRFLQKIEAASINLSVDIVVRMADCLGVPPGLLLRKTKFVKPPKGRPRRPRG
jgi:transcriptional regulator with XRE-family HTH domain